MDLRHLVSADHANIRQIADQIRRSAGRDGVTGRDRLFEQFDDEVRRHMMLMETVVMPALSSDPGVPREPHATHHDLMQRLDDLGDGDPGSADWTDRFEAFAEALDRMFGEHMQMVAALPDSGRIASAYRRAKLKSLRAASRGPRGWLLGLGLGLAGAAVATTMLRRRARSPGSMSTSDDVEPTRRRLRTRTVIVQTTPVETPLTSIH